MLKYLTKVLCEFHFIIGVPTVLTLKYLNVKINIDYDDVKNTIEQLLEKSKSYKHL